MAKTLIKNFELTDEWARVPIYGVSVKYYVHLDGTVISLHNKEYIERLESYGRKVVYTTANVIQNAPAKKKTHGDRVTLIIGSRNGKPQYASYLRQNVVWASWRNKPEMLITNAIKNKPIEFIDGNIHNCALSNLTERYDYCYCPEQGTIAYKREYGWIANQLRQMDYGVEFDTIRDIVGESFVLTLTRLCYGNNDSHRIGIFWFRIAKQLLLDVALKKMSVDCYTRNLNLKYSPISI